MNKKRVLIVEDDEMIAELEREILEKEGFEIEIAQDGAEGLERLKQDEYNVVISDYHTSKMKGDEFYLKVKRLNQGLEKRIIFVSGTINDFVESTGNIFLRKPFSNEQFLEVVKDLATSIEFSQKQQK